MKLHEAQRDVVEDAEAGQTVQPSAGVNLPADVALRQLKNQIAVLSPSTRERDRGRKV
jgi:hypothetical protein